MNTSLLLIIITTALVNNVVLSQFLGICSFLGVSKQIKTSLSLGVAVIFVITLSSGVASLLYDFLLVPLHLEYLETIVLDAASSTIVSRYSRCSGTSRKSYSRLATPEERVMTKITATPRLRDVLICFETPRKEQMPKNWLSTTLLTSAVVIMIKSKEVFIRFFPPYVHCGSRPCCSDCSSRHSRSPDLSNGWRYGMRSTLR